MTALGFPQVVSALGGAGVRFVLIGVEGANHYARAAGMVFATQDFDLFLPPEPANELHAWRACDSLGLELWCGDEPLDRPLDELLARQVVARSALVRASGRGVQIDLTLAMAGFEFEDVWSERRLFRVRGVDVPVARLAQIVSSKGAAGRPKDLLFLASHEEALRQLMPRRYGRRP